MSARRRRWSRGDLAFAAAFAAYLAVTAAVLVAGLLVYLASTTPDFHSYLHTVGFGAETTTDRVALGIAAAAHLPQSLSGIAVDYGVQRLQSLPSLSSSCACVPATAPP